MEITENEKLQIAYGKLKSRRAKIISDQKDLLDTVEGEKRELSAVETMLFESMENEFNNLIPSIEKFEKDHPEIAKRCNTPCKPGLSGDNNLEIRKNFNMENRKSIFHSDDAEIRNFVKYLTTGETRGLLKTVDSQGGYAVVPTSVLAEILHGIDSDVALLNLCRRFVMKSDSKGIPCVQTPMSDASFSGEITELSWDTSLDLESRYLYPKRLVKGIKVSRDLLMLSEADMAAFIISRLQYALSCSIESELMTGNGTASPLGIFTISASGIPASRDVTAGNTTTSVTADALWNTLYGLKAQYLRSKSCRWVLHRNILKMIRKMKTGDGDYIWKSGIADASPATICGLPYTVSEFAPSAPTSGQRALVVGAFEFYGVGTYEGEPEVRVLDQLFAASNQNAYTIQLHIDGMPLCAEAFSCCTLA